MDSKLDIAKSMVDYVGKIRSYVPVLADNYREKKYEEAMDGMLDLIEGLEWMVSASSILEPEIDFDNDKIINILPEIQSALENADYNLLADVLDYEVVPVSTEIENKYNEFISNSMN